MSSVISPLQYFSHGKVTTENYTLSLHDALPIFEEDAAAGADQCPAITVFTTRVDTIFGATSIQVAPEDRKSTRLNSSHVSTSYAVFSLKNKTPTPLTDCSIPTVTSGSPHCASAP